MFKYLTTPRYCCIVLAVILGLIQAPLGCSGYVTNLLPWGTRSQVFDYQIGTEHLVNNAGWGHDDIALVRVSELLNRQHSPLQLPATPCPEGTSLFIDESVDGSLAEDRLENVSQDAVKVSLHLYDLTSQYAASVYTRNLFGSALDRCIDLSQMNL